MNMMITNKKDFTLVTNDHDDHGDHHDNFDDYGDDYFDGIATSGNRWSPPWVLPHLWAWASGDYYWCLSSWRNLIMFVNMVQLRPHLWTWPSSKYSMIITTSFATNYNSFTTIEQGVTNKSYMISIFIYFFVKATWFKDDVPLLGALDFDEKWEPPHLWYKLSASLSILSQ